MMGIGTIIRTIYHEMQKHYPTFRFLVWLKEKGITRRVNYIISHGNDKYDIGMPTSEMLFSQDFFDDPINKARFESNMMLLADEKSKAVMRSVLAYRKYKTPIPKGLYSEDDQYFVEDIVNLCEEEVFVDGGAYTGDTIQQLIDVARKKGVKVKQIIAFEPDDENYNLLEKFYGRHNNISIYKKGLSNKEGSLYFKNEGVCARIVDLESESTSRVDVIDIDSIPECKSATYIKMDIEGAEWAALHGAEKIIKLNEPKLAICLYHSDEDIVRLIEYVHDLVPTYKLYVRHHSRSDVETVLYAIK